MHPLLSIVLAAAVGGVASALLAGLFLLTSERVRAAAVPSLVSFAIGSLLGAAFIGLLPEAYDALGVEKGFEIGIAVVAGLLLFFLIEKYVLWRHCHGESPERHAVVKAAGTLVLIGDSLHNFIDGLLLAAAFLSDPGVGIAATAAVAAHEIPQELGDLGVLLHSGYKPRTALLLNAASGLAMVLGGLLGYAALSALRPAIPFMLALAAASFVYVAAADLIPEQQKRLGLRASLQQVGLIAAGAGLIALVHHLVE